MRQELVDLLNKYGVRGVVDQIASILDAKSDAGESLPYDTVNFKDNDPVDPGDLANAANVLRGDLW